MNTTRRYIVSLILVLFGSLFFCGSLIGQKLSEKEKKILNNINKKLYVHKNRGIDSARAEVKTLLMYNWAYREKGIEISGGWPVIAYHWEFTFRAPDNYRVRLGRTDLLKVMNDHSHGHASQQKRGLKRFKDNSALLFVRKYRKILKKRLSFLFRRFVVIKPFKPRQNNDLYMYLKEKKKRAILVENFGVPEDVRFVFDYKGNLRGIQFDHPKLAPFPYNIQVPVEEFNAETKMASPSSIRPSALLTKFQSDWEFYQYGDPLKEKPEQPVAGKFYGDKKVRIGTRFRGKFMYSAIASQSSNNKKLNVVFPRKITLVQKGETHDHRKSKAEGGGSIETSGGASGGGWGWIYQNTFTTTYREHIIFQNLNINGLHEESELKTRQAIQEKDK